LGPRQAAEFQRSSLEVKIVADANVRFVVAAVAAGVRVMSVSGY